MIRISLLLILLWTSAIRESSTAAIFDQTTCKDGCRKSTDCPANAHCVAVTQTSDCGLCLCQAGYRTEDRSCVPNENKSKSVKSSDKKSGNPGDGTTTINHDGGGNGVQTTAAPQTDAPATITTTSPGPTTQGGPPDSVPLSCADYSCSPQIQNSDSDNPFTVRAQLFSESSNSNCKRKLNIGGRPCQMKGGGTCYGIYCLSVEPGNDYCICPFYRIDRQCAVDKPGNCESGTGQLPPNAYKAQNKRFRNKNNPDNGSIFGRHFAASMDDCVKLCQWAGGAQCRSVNYGQLGGQRVCELLSVAVAKGGMTEPWLINAPGWQYAQVSSQIGL